MFENRKKKITAGVGVAAIAAAVIGLTAGTYAGFSDSEQSDITSADVATLDLADDSLLTTVTNLLPGVTNQVLGTLLYTNNGSVPATLNAVIGASGEDGEICEIPLVGGLLGQVQVVNDIGNVLCPIVAGAINHLEGLLTVSFSIIDNTAAGVPALPGAGSLTSLLGSDDDIDLNLGVLQPGESVEIDILGTIASSVTNIIQDDLINLDSVATLSQIP